MKEYCHLAWVFTHSLFTHISFCVCNLSNPYDNNIKKSAYFIKIHQMLPNVYSIRHLDSLLTGKCRPLVASVSVLCLLLCLSVFGSKVFIHCKNDNFVKDTLNEWEMYIAVSMFSGYELERRNRLNTGIHCKEWNTH